MAIAIRSRQITLHVADEPDPDHGTVTDPASAVAIASALIADHAHETVIVLMLDSRNRVRGHHVAAVGTLNAARLSARDVFTPALLANAASVIIAHNHPSGDPTPSGADRQVVDALRTAGTLLGVPLTDSLIVAPNGYHSFRASEDWDNAR